MDNDRLKPVRSLCVLAGGQCTEDPPPTTDGREDKVEVDQLHSAEDNWVQIMEGPFRQRVSRKGLAGFLVKALAVLGLQTARLRAVWCLPV